MKKITLIFVGVVATFMLKQAFLLEPNFSKNNFWIIIGTGLLCYLGAQNYYLRSKQNSKELTQKERTTTLEVGMDLKLELKLRGIIARDGKIEAIKICREETQMGLREAKNFVDALEA